MLSVATSAAQTNKKIRLISLNMSMLCRRIHDPCASLQPQGSGALLRGLATAPTLWKKHTVMLRVATSA
jgi:hypothetical protein